MQAQAFGTPFPSNIDLLFRNALVHVLQERASDVLFQKDAPDFLDEKEGIEGIDFQFLQSLVNRYSAIAGTQPGYPNTYLILCISLALLGKWKEAIAACAKGLDIYSKYLHPESTERISLLFFAQGYAQGSIAFEGQTEEHHSILSEAQESFRAAGESKPDFAEAYCYLGLAHQLSGNFEGAQSNLERSISIRPNYWEALNDLGLLYNRLGNHQKALQKLMKAAQINSHNSIPLVNIGAIHINLGELYFEEAKMFLTKAVSLEGNNAAAHINLSIVFLRLGNLQESAQEFISASNIKPNIEIPELKFLYRVLTLESLPLFTDENGVMKVLGTRVSLDTIIIAYNQGDTPEEIVQDYPSLNLADVYSVISYYLRRTEDVEDYLAKRQEHAKNIRRLNEKHFSPTGIRERLLSRQSKRTS